jgi:hypothetical protein
MIVNIYAPNIGAPYYTKKAQVEHKAQIDTNTIKVGDVNIPQKSILRSSKQKHQ